MIIIDVLIIIIIVGVGVVFNYLVLIIIIDFSHPVIVGNITAIVTITDTRERVDINKTNLELLLMLFSRWFLFCC